MPAINPGTPEEEEGAGCCVGGVCWARKAEPRSHLETHQVPHAEAQADLSPAHASGPALCQFALPNFIPVAKEPVNEVT